jgi:transcriptional regulator with XRE-family HTH domain
MAKSSQHNDFLPPQALQSVQALGADLALARKRRKQSLREWAARMGVSVRTLQRMEQGDPGVGMGIYAMAVWLLGRSQALAQVALPELDMAALDQDIAKAKQRGQAKSKAAI